MFRFEAPQVVTPLFEERSSIFEEYSLVCEPADNIGLSAEEHIRNHIKKVNWDFRMTILSNKDIIIHPEKKKKEVIHFDLFENKIVRERTPSSIELVFWDNRSVMPVFIPKEWNRLGIKYVVNKDSNPVYLNDELVMLVRHHELMTTPKETFARHMVKHILLTDYWDEEPTEENIIRLHNYTTNRDFSLCGSKTKLKKWLFSFLGKHINEIKTILKYLNDDFSSYWGPSSLEPICQDYLNDLSIDMVTAPNYYFHYYEAATMLSFHDRYAPNPYKPHIWAGVDYAKDDA